MASSDTTRWRTIETAPLNGQRIILSLYRERSLVWVTEDGWNEDRQEWSDDPDMRPTHWMEIPELPL